MGNITINADDLGMKSSVNKAIVESFSRGFINSATLMANMAGFEEAVTLIHDHKLDGKIGVHLVLTEGLPITDEIKSMNLLFNKKNIPSNLRMRKLFFLNKKDQILIYKEYSAQIERVMKNGIQITHLDTHHQIHDMWAILQIMIELLKTYNIP